MVIKPSDIKVEVTIIRANGTEEPLGAVSLFKEGNVNDNGTNESGEE